MISSDFFQLLDVMNLNRTPRCKLWNFSSHAGTLDLPCEFLFLTLIYLATLGCTWDLSWKHMDSLAVVCGLPGCGVWTLWLWCVDSLAVALRVQLVCSVIVVHGLSCSQACGILVSWPGMDRTCVPCMTTWILHNWTTREVPPSKLLRLFSKSLV